MMLIDSFDGLKLFLDDGKAFISHALAKFSVGKKLTDFFSSRSMIPHLNKKTIPPINYLAHDAGNGCSYDRLCAGHGLGECKAKTFVFRGERNSICGVVVGRKLLIWHISCKENAVLKRQFVNEPMHLIYVFFPLP